MFFFFIFRSLSFHVPPCYAVEGEWKYAMFSSIMAMLFNGEILFSALVKSFSFSSRFFPLLNVHVSVLSFFSAPFLISLSKCIFYDFRDKKHQHLNPFSWMLEIIIQWWAKWRMIYLSKKLIIHLKKTIIFRLIFSLYS